MRNACPGSVARALPATNRPLASCTVRMRRYTARPLDLSRARRAISETAQRMNHKKSRALGSCRCACWAVARRLTQGRPKTAPPAFRKFAQAFSVRRLLLCPVIRTARQTFGTVLLFIHLSNSLIFVCFLVCLLH